MRKTGLWMTVGCLAAMAALVWAQAVRKAGLWEVTSQMTWQQSPLPPGMQMPAGMPNPFNQPPRTNQVCLTQAMIDRYGAPVPQAQNPRGQNDCKMSNVVLTANSMTAEMTCTGSMNGHGTMQSTWQGDTAKGKLHFTGTMQGGGPGGGGGPRPVEWTVESTSTYKGPDCGSVRPAPMPDSN
ncbi:MAG: DUF3617 family protein [Terracidiphilus sp.]